MILTTQQKYIKDKLPDLNIKNFYIQFGFKSREIAETKFKKVIVKLRELVDEELKDFIVEEYISDNCQCLDTTILDEYWLTTQRQVNEMNILKRKGEASRSQIPEPKKSNKDKKLSTLLTKEGIVDLSNLGSSSQSHIIEWKDEKGKAASTVSFEMNIDFKKAIYKVFNNRDHINVQYRKTLDYQRNSSAEDLFFYKLLTHLIEAHQINPHVFDIDEQKKLSEKDYDNKIYTRIFELLFSDRSDIVIKDGDTKMDMFKIDYRIGFYYKDSFVDVSSIEVGRAATTTKVKDVISN